MFDNAVLGLLRAIRGDIDVMASNIRDVTHRLTSLEISVAGMRCDIAGFFAQQSLSRLRNRTLDDCIERRWDLIDHPPS